MSKEEIGHWRGLEDDSPFLGHFSILELNVKEVEVTIEEVGHKVFELMNFKTRKIEKQRKGYIKFKEFKKLMLLHKKNPASIESMYGYKPAAWIGEKIVIYATKDRGTGGKEVDCIRIREEKPKPVDTEGIKARCSASKDKKELMAVWVGLDRKSVV